MCEAAVLDAAAGLLRSARRMIGLPEDYAHALRTDHVSQLLVRTGTDLLTMRFGSDAVAMALPWGADGYLIACDTHASHAAQQLAIKHELAHVLAGDAADLIFLDGEGEASHTERVADLFAVVDLTPLWWMRYRRGKRRPWVHLTLDVVQAFRELTDGWPESRLWDRARLRVALYRTHGV